MRPIFTLFFLALAQLTFAQVQSCQDIVFPTLNSSLYQGVYYNDLRWDDDHKIITVNFINGSAFLQNKVKQYAVEWGTYANFPKDEIKEFWDQGYHVTSLSYGNGLWALVMSKGAGYQSQSWRTRRNFPQAEIDELWKK